PYAGGFYWYCRFSVVVSQTTSRSVLGLFSSVGNIANADPSTLTNCVFFGNDSADTHLQVMQNDGAGNCTKVDLGANFPSQTRDTDTYEAAFLAASGQTSSINYYIRNIISGAAASTGALSTNLPAANTFMEPYMWLNNGTTAAAVRLGIAS